MGLVLCIVVMTAGLMLGGGTRPGFLSDAVLQLVSIPLLLFAIAGHGAIPPERRVVWVWLTVGALVLIPVLQLVPLPDRLWQFLPNRAMVSEVMDLSGQVRPAFPVSVAPRETWLAALSLIPPIAIFLGTLLLTYAQRRLLSLAVIGIGVLSMILGLLQVGQGRSSPLRFFAITNAEDAVGFFANRNHFAALNYSLTLLLGAWLVSLVTAPNSGRRLRSRDSTWVLYLLLGLTAFATQIATQAMTRSRMGAALMLVALAAVVALSLKARGTDENKAGSTRIIVGVSLFGLFMISQYALLAALDRFMGTDPLKDGRIAFARNTIEAARDFMPWGGGVGTFVSIYPIYEKIPDLMSDSFANRAHNDILEIWLETGIFGPVLLAGFAIWLVTRAFHLWRDREWTGLLLDLQLARAAAVILLLLLVHSFVDYPLRTGALMVLAGFCCALLVPPILRNADDGLETVLSASAARREASRPLQPVTIAPSLAGRLPGTPPQAMESDSLGTAPSRTTWPGTAWPGVGPTEPRDAEPPRHADAAAGWPQAQESGPEPPPALRDRVGEAHWPQDWEKPADRDPRRVRPAVSPGSAGPVKEPTSKK